MDKFFGFKEIRKHDIPALNQEMDGLMRRFIRYKKYFKFAFLASIAGAVLLAGLCILGMILQETGYIFKG